MDNDLGTDSVGTRGKGLTLVVLFFVLELSLMFSLLDRIPKGVEPMLTDIQTYIVQSGIDDMKACAEIITTVSGRGGSCKIWHEGTMEERGACS